MRSRLFMEVVLAPPWHGSVQWAARASLNNKDPDRYVIRITTNVKPSDNATPDHFDERSGKPMYTRIVYGSKVK